MSFTRELFTASCALAIVAGLGWSGAMAQEAAEAVSVTEGQQADSEEGDVITVTGSRIRRSNATSAIPVQILGAGDIEEIGTVDVGEIVTEIPGVDFDLSPESTNLSVQNAGLSTVNLRRLGGNRTLTLIDGRRAVSNAGNGERVSLNTVPAGFVDSVEVTTGGASAIYGSDAIAGVVNVILKDDWEGFEINARYNEPERSGDEETTLDLTWGKNFADGRGNFLLGLSYENEEPIFADDTRPESVMAIEWDTPSYAGDFNDEAVFPGCEDGGYCFNPSLSSYIPGGRFESDDAWNIGGVWYNDKSLLPDDGRTASDGFDNYPDGYNIRPGRTLSSAYEMWSGAIKSDYELTPKVSVFFDAMYSEIETMSRNAPETAIYGDEFALLDANGNALRDDEGRVITDELRQMSSSHPFIPPEVEETRSGSVSWYRRFTELGWDDKINDRKTLRTAFGFEGTVWEDWQWTLYGTYGRYEQVQNDINEINLQNLDYALDVESDGNGGYQCDSDEARAAGCVPINLFGEGSITPAMADYIRYDAELYQEREQRTIAGSMNGDLYELPAGFIKAAFGFEYRDEYQNTYGQGGDIIMQTTSTGVPDIEADFDVREVFGELDIPLLETVSAQLAVRVADYSTVGEVVSYNVGGSWFPTSDIRFRAQYSRSQRAPTLTEFFSPPRGDFDSLLDPCDGLMPDGSGITPPAGSDVSATLIANNCLAEPGIQAYFANPDNSGEPFTYDGSVRGPNQGNNQLTEETADTFTAGFVFTPSFIPELALIVDYYDIEVKDAIGSVSTQLTADLCYTADQFPDNKFCNVITRNSQTGNISEVINQVENLDTYVAEGIDVSLDYEWEFKQVPGEFDINMIYSHYFDDSYSFQGLNGLEEEDTLGLIGNTEDEYRFKLGWSHNGFRAVFTTHYESGGVDDLDIGPDDDRYFEVDGQAYHDLYLRYTLKQDPRINIYGGIRNLENDLGPFLPTGLDNGNSRNITSSMNDADGREFYAGIRARW